MEVSDQRVAAPARPDLGEGDRAQHPHRDVRSVRVVEHEPGRGHGERAAGRGALQVNGVARRPAPPRAVEPVHVPGQVRRGQLRGERQEAVRVEPARGGAGRGERAFERPAESAERGLRSRSWRTRERAAHEHPVVRQREWRAARVQRTPAGMGQEPLPPLADRHLHRFGIAARRAPGIERGSEARARPVHDLHRAMLRRRVGQRARERAQSLLVDPGKGRDLDDEPGRARVDVELAPLVEGAPGQEVDHRRRDLRRRPRLESGRTLEQVREAGQHQGRFQSAGAITMRT